jgi:hypothetical protein
LRTPTASVTLTLLKGDPLTSGYPEPAWSNILQFIININLVA